MSPFLSRTVRVVAIRRRERDADAGADDHLVTMQVVGRAQRLDEPLRQRGRPPRGCSALGLDDGEFVAAEARDRVALAHAALQPRRDLLEQRVAGRMAERVVHALEAVEVEAQDRRAAVARGRACSAVVRSSANERGWAGR